MKSINISTNVELKHILQVKFLMLIEVNEKLSIKVSMNVILFFEVLYEGKFNLIRITNVYCLVMIGTKNENINKFKGTKITYTKILVNNQNSGTKSVDGLITYKLSVISVFL
ncbi:hypothetical protein BTO28_12760 [Domibacillus epiphyticus]|uniref:Uncharacterized protein n=1 Tax=Domibacillus epiphyticus TaxID=1714355 RepID=A0A1V2A5S0_9BACI|nr:hypothetical protein BTO28_12760 [Domibacillus epiphyticus]